MKIFNGQIDKIAVMLLVFFAGNYAQESLAQNSNLMMFSLEPQGEFADLKKFGMKENFERPHSYDNKEFKPNSPKTNSSSVKYEFAIFKSESESSLDRKTIEGGFIFLDRQQFKNLGLSLIKGDLNAVFNNDFNIFISDKIARLYFGDEEPLDKILILEGKYSVMIKGVFKSKTNSLPMEFDFIAGHKTNEEIKKR